MNGKNLLLSYRYVALCVLVILISSQVFGRSPKRVDHDVTRPNKFIVVLTDRAPSSTHGLALSIAMSYHVPIEAVYPYAIGGFLVTCDDATADAIADDPRVEWVESDGILEVEDGIQETSGGMSSSDSTVFNGQNLWFLDRIDSMYPTDSDNHYAYCATGQKTVTYMIDTGAWADHVELAGKVIGARDFVSPLSDAFHPCAGFPNLWHGTATASVVAGANTGVAKGTKLVSLKVTDCNANMYVDRLLGALNWIVAGPDVQPGLAALAPNTYLSQVDGTYRGIVNFSGFVQPKSTTWYQKPDGQYWYSPASKSRRRRSSTPATCS